MSLFQINNSDYVSQLILNALETYKKILVCETTMQNKVTGPTLENLIKSLMIITCHRKDYDHQRNQRRSLKATHQAMPTLHLRRYRTRPPADGVHATDGRAKPRELESLRQHHRRSRGGSA
jgi:hypothetical protein